METAIVYRDNEKENGKCYSILGLYWDGGKKMEATIVYCGYIGIMEDEMETTVELKLL